MIFTLGLLIPLSESHSISLHTLLHTPGMTPFCIDSLHARRVT